MKNMTRTTKTAFLAISIIALSSGCAMKTKIMDVSGISMTRMNLKEGETLQETGPVKGEFCQDSMNDKGGMGLLDEATTHAQKQHSVDFITSAVFFSTGNCVSIEGTGQKIVAATGADDGSHAKKGKKH